MSVLHSISDRELKNFIKFGEKNIVEVGLVFGDCWATKAIEIAKALRDRLAKPEREWVGLTDEEILSDDTLRYYYGMNGGAGPVSQKGKKVIAAIEAKLKEKNS